MRVRIKVLINAAGQWAAYGWDDAKDGDQDEVIFDMMSGNDLDVSACVYVSANIPLPRRREHEIKGKCEIGPGRNGGLARAAALSPERRSQIARTAAAARWGKP